MTTSPLITRKEISTLYGVTERQIVRNEKRWKLDRARTKFGFNPVLYRRDIVISIMDALDAVGCGIPR